MDKIESKGIVKELKVILDYPEEIGLPQYCNFVLVRFTNYEYTFDFAAIDPKQLKLNEDLPDEMIKATVVKRVCMNHEVARQFLKAFIENHKKFDEISGVKQ